MFNIFRGMSDKTRVGKISLGDKRVVQRIGRLNYLGGSSPGEWGMVGPLAHALVH